MVFSRRSMQDPHEDTDCGNGPPQPARFTLDTLSIQDVGTAYLNLPAKMLQNTCDVSSVSGLGHGGYVYRQ